MVFGAHTIFPFRSKLKKKVSNAANLKNLVTNPTSESSIYSKGATNKDDGAFLAEAFSEMDGELKRSPVFSNPEKCSGAVITKTSPQKIEQRSDPSNINTFVVGGEYGSHCSITILQLINLIIKLFLFEKHRLMYTVRTSSNTAGLL